MGKAKYSAKKPEMKINSILIGLIASVILNLMLIAPYMAILTTRLFDQNLYILFYTRTYNINDEVTINGKTWTCLRAEFLPQNWLQEGHKFCTTSALFDKDNQEVK